MILGHIGEHRELSLEEQRERFGQQCRDAQALDKLETEQGETKTLAGKFAEALGCLEDALHWLRQVNEEYDPDKHIDDTPPVRGYSLHRCKPVMDFWLQAEQAEEQLKNILRRLQRVEPLAPKEGAA